MRIDMMENADGEPIEFATGNPPLDWALCNAFMTPVTS